MKHDIASRVDIELLVDTFYAAVRLDEEIGPIFESRIEQRWPAHLAKMYSFWETVLLGNHTYAGAPFRPHATMQLSETHFAKWLHLFHQTVDAHFEGVVATEAKARGNMMATLFMSKINFLKNNPRHKPLI